MLKTAGVPPGPSVNALRRYARCESQPYLYPVALRRFNINDVQLRVQFSHSAYLFKKRFELFPADTNAVSVPVKYFGDDKRAEAAEKNTARQENQEPVRTFPLAFGGSEKYAHVIQPLFQRYHRRRFRYRQACRLLRFRSSALSFAYRCSVMLYCLQTEACSDRFQAPSLRAVPAD